MNDPEVYKDPEKFNPSRFLGDSPEPEPEKQGNFGYGRRICPGKALADQSGWLFVAHILSVFEIAPKKDAHGQEIEVDLEGAPGLVLHPKPYAVDIRPRSEKHAQMIEAFESELIWEKGDANEIHKLLA